jgi:alpha-tubulin suppressor-like RCC1 family protein
MSLLVGDTLYFSADGSSGHELWAHQPGEITSLSSGSGSGSGSGSSSSSSFAYANNMVSGVFHTCAILDNGNVKCWGYNTAGALGDGSTADSDAPSTTVINLGTGRTAVALSGGNAHTCAILDNGDLKCWGSDEYGQLGNGNSITADQTSPPSTAIDLGTGRTAVAVTAETYHT